MMPGIRISSPSAIASTSISLPWIYWSIRTGCSVESDTASFIYLLSSTSLYTTCIARPPITYDGLTTSGYPSFLTAAKASSSLVTATPSGTAMPSSSRSSQNFSLSSARSILLYNVPSMFMLRLLSFSARFSDVCPPNCMITP